MITIFYPTNKKVVTVLLGTLTDGDVCGTKVWIHAISDAPITKGVKFPVINSSHRYMVIYGSTLCVPDGTKIILTLKDVWNLPRDPNYRIRL